MSASVGCTVCVDLVLGLGGLGGLVEFGLVLVLALESRPGGAMGDISRSYAAITTIERLRRALRLVGLVYWLGFFGVLAGVPTGAESRSVPSFYITQRFGL